MPFKANADRRHHIPRQHHRVTNWPAYEAGLRARGSLTVWFTAEAIGAWRAERRTTRGGQPRYSALAITTALTLRTVFHLALRQTEGLTASIVGTRTRRGWRKLHLAIDADTGLIVASELTDKVPTMAHRLARCSTRWRGRWRPFADRPASEHRGSDCRRRAEPHA